MNFSDEIYSYQYRCVVTGGTGKKAVSEAARLDVFGITLQPKSKYVRTGTTALFRTTAVGKGLTYQWQYRTSESASWKNCTSKTAGYRSELLKVAAETGRDGYRYRCRIKDGTGLTAVTAPAELHIFGITVQPAPVYTVPGKTVTYQVSACGRVKSYCWQVKEAGSTVWKDCAATVTGYNKPALKITAAIEQDGRMYRCRITDDTGKTVVSDAAAFAVFGIRTQPETVYVSLGDTAAFQIKACGKGLSYRWQYRISTSGNWKDVTIMEPGTPEGSLKVTAMTGYDGRQYRCIVSDSVGNTATSKPASLIVLAGSSRLKPCRYNNLYLAEDVYRCWDALCGRYITKRVLGTVSGYDIPVYTIDCAPGHLDQTYGEDDSWLYQRPRILIVACQHGDERDSAAGLLSAVEEILNDPNLAKTAANVVWDIVPVVNPWGFSHSVVNASGTMVSGSKYFGGTLPEGWRVVENTAYSGRGIRFNEMGYDINRDFSDTVYNYSSSGTVLPHGFQTQEAQLIRNLLIQNSYRAVLDIHKAGAGEASRNGNVCGFVSVNNQPFSLMESEYESVKTTVFKGIERVNHRMELLCTNTFLDGEISAEAHFQVWDGKTTKTLRNYAGGAGGNTEHPELAARISTCMETSLYCTSLTGETAICTRKTRDITANYILLFMEELAGMV